MAGLWRKHGFRLVPLAATDVLSGLETGLFQTLPAAPIAALSLQWYRSAPYMTDLPLVPLLGATVITERAWQSLPADRRAGLLAAAVDTGTLFAEEIPAEERKAIVEMERRGLETIRVVGTEAEAEWRSSMARFAESMRETFVPKDIYDAAVAARAAYRNSRSGQAGRPEPSESRPRVAQA